jgi:glycine cleavage system H lipoate-binding protein
MTGHDIFTMQAIKAAEYAIAVTYLLLFFPFWRFVNGGRAAERAAEAPRWLGQVAGWFHVPDHVYFHPGHAWARLDGDVATVGMNDFAHRLVGPATMRLPEVGTQLAQGERGWTLVSGDKSVDMLSPVDGTVIAVNPRMLAAPEAVDGDMYGDGWLVKVRSPRIAANAKQLLKGSLARRWMEEACEGLATMMSPELGRVYQDGGRPVHGMARSLDPERWDDIARRFLLTSTGRDER